MARVRPKYPPNTNDMLEQLLEGGAANAGRGAPRKVNINAPIGVRQKIGELQRLRSARQMESPDNMKILK